MLLDHLLLLNCTSGVVQARIFKDVTEDGDSASEGEAEAEVEGEEGEGEGEEDEGGGRIQEVKWSVPDGFQVANEPEALDKSLVGEQIYMRWETYGWQLGKITDIITKDTPRLIKKFNYRCMWADGSKGPAMLGVQNNAYGPDAHFNSWVVLEAGAV